MSNQISEKIQEHFNKHEYLQANLDIETIEDKNTLKCAICGEVIVVIE